MRAAMKKISLFAGMVSCCAMLSGCLTHWFVDSTTRLQVENKTNQTIVEIGIVSEDGSAYRIWIQDTIPVGEKSRVYEADWVGTFIMQVKTTKASFRFNDIELEGGSEYMVLTDSTDGLHYRFR